VSRQHELSKRVGVLDEELASAYSLIDSLHRDKTASPGPTGGEMQGQVLSDAIGEAMTTVEELAALQTRLATLDMALQRAEAKEKEAAEEAVRLAQELEAARLGWGEERRAAGEALGVAQERMREMAAALEMVQEESEGLQRDLVQVLTPPSSTAVSPTQLLSPGVTSPGPTPRLQTHPVAMFSGEVVASSPEPPQLTSQSSRSPPVRTTATPARQEAEEVVGDAVAAAVATASSSPQLSQHTKVGVAKEFGDTVADMIMEWALQAHGEKRPR